MKILVADDNANGRELIADIVREMGHQVALAWDGPSALMEARALLPDLILLDVEMPGLTGFEVCSLLRADDRTSRIPIIMLTALHTPEDRVFGLNIGADDYLTKPFSPRELEARIEKRLQAKAEVDESREQQQAIRRTFERFVEPRVVQRLLANPSLVKLGGELQEVTVLFADLEGFTALSERTPPEQVLSVLNRYHALVLDLVQRNHGAVNKFIGDGVMALFNTPLPHERHALCAVETALAVREALSEFHRGFEPAHRLGINFGIHTGQAVVGNVGTAQFMEYTAVGDTVNLASRMQELARQSQILITDKTYESVRDHVAVQSLGPIQVKNRAEAVQTYEVLGRR